jgi:glycosyltransferase involved in cell wall biosynthesis
MPIVAQVVQQGQFRGAEVFALDLARALKRQGPSGRQAWDATMVSLFDIDGAYGAAVKEAGLGIAAVQNAGSRQGFDLRLALRLKTMIDSYRCDVVQANGAGTLKYLVAARRFARRPWRLVYRAIGMGSYWRRGLARQLSYRWLFSQPDMIVAVCQAVADDLRASMQIDPARIVVVPNGVEPSRIVAAPQAREQVRSALGMAPSDVLILYAGNLAPEKNLDAIVRAVAAGRAEGLPVRAVLVGDGPAKPALEASARAAGIGDAIRYVPPQANIGAYLAAADLCMLPSRSEGMPGMLIEAAMCGKPSIASRVGGIPEVIEDGVTGLLVDPADEPGFIRAVATLVREGSTRTAMGAAARAAGQRYRIETIAGAYSDLYVKVLAGARAA